MRLASFHVMCKLCANISSANSGNSHGTWGWPWTRHQRRWLLRPDPKSSLSGTLRGSRRGVSWHPAPTRESIGAGGSRFANGTSVKQLDPEMVAAHIARLEALREVSLGEHDKYPPCIVRRGRC